MLALARASGLLVALAGMYLPLSVPSQAQELQITSPSDKSIVAPGQNIGISVEGAKPGTTLSIDPPDVLLIVPDSLPGTYILMIPRGVPSGPYLIKTDAEEESSAKLTIDVERDESPLSIQLAPEALTLPAPNAQGTVHLIGSYPNGEQADISKSSYTSFSSEHPNITDVLPGGILAANNFGETTITAKHRELSASITVRIDEKEEKPSEAQKEKTEAFSNSPSAQAEQRICRLQGEGLGFSACPFPIWRGNSFDTLNLNTGARHKAYFDTQIFGVRSDPGIAQVPIHAFDQCYFVDNHSTSSFFVPFQSREEWKAFVANHPKTVSLRGCTLHGVYTSLSATSKGDHAVFNLPSYSMSGTTETLAQTFGYSESAECTTPDDCPDPEAWTETITAIFRAEPPVWKIVGETVVRSPTSSAD